MSMNQEGPQKNCMQIMSNLSLSPYLARKYVNGFLSLLIFCIVYLFLDEWCMEM